MSFWYSSYSNIWLDVLKTTLAWELGNLSARWICIWSLATLGLFFFFFSICTKKEPHGVILNWPFQFKKSLHKCAESLLVYHSFSFLEVKPTSKSWSLIDFEIGPHFNSQVLSMRATFNMVLKYLMQKSARVIDWNIYLNINEFRFAKMRSPCCHGHKCLTFWFAFLF